LVCLRKNFYSGVAPASIPKNLHLTLQRRLREMPDRLVQFSAAPFGNWEIMGKLRSALTFKNFHLWTYESESSPHSGFVNTIPKNI
jgi:hypothetical protein